MFPLDSDLIVSLRPVLPWRQTTNQRWLSSWFRNATTRDYLRTITMIRTRWTGVGTYSQVRKFYKQLIPHIATMVSPMYSAAADWSQNGLPSQMLYIWRYRCGHEDLSSDWIWLLLVQSCWHQGNHPTEFAYIWSCGLRIQQTIYIISSCL